MTLAPSLLSSSSAVSVLVSPLTGVSYSSPQKHSQQQYHPVGFTSQTSSSGERAMGFTSPISTVENESGVAGEATTNRAEGGAGGGSGIYSQVLPSTSLQCPVCPYLGQDKFHIERHLRSHTGERPFACTVCPYRANRYEHLQRHWLVHTGERPFCCSLCPYRCSQKHHLVRHVASAHKDLNADVSLVTNTSFTGSEESK